MNHIRLKGMGRLRVRSKQIILSLILLVLGFLISFSYQLTSSGKERIGQAREWEKEYSYREELIKLEEKSESLQKELFEKQQRVREIEENLAQEKKTMFNLVEDIEKLRMLAGLVPVKGPGIQVTLSDASYVGSVENANNYIVHESHLHKVVNELLASGAKAVAINGQRLLHNTYIVCVGPVVSVDGNEYNAPFVVTALGDPQILETSLNLSQGVKDQLVNDNIEVRIEKKAEIILEPYLGTTEGQT